MLPNKANVLRKCLSQSNEERCWLDQNVDFVAVIVGGNDLVEADDRTTQSTVYVYDWH